MPVRSTRSVGRTRQTRTPKNLALTQTVDENHRHNMIAEAAYYTAEQRGSGPGDELADWLMSERRIDMQIVGPQNRTLRSV